MCSWRTSLVVLLHAPTVFSLVTNLSLRTRDDDPLSSHRDSYLVDPASSHMLVSKIKPCMSKYKQIHTVKLRMAH